MNINKLHHNPTQSQEKNYLPTNFIFVPSDQIVNTIATLSSSELLILNDLIFTLGSYGICFKSQQNLGRYANVSRQTVNRWFKDWERRGIIRKTTRAYQTCLYEVPTAIFGHLRDRLKPYLAALKRLLFINLLSVSWITASGADIKDNVTLLYEYSYLYNKNRSEKVQSISRLGNASPLPGSIAPPAGTFLHKKNKLRAWEAFADRGLLAHPLFNDPEFQKKGIAMNHKQSDVLFTTETKPTEELASTSELPFGPVIRQLEKDLGLTAWGKIKLSPFSEKTISIAYQQLCKQQKRIDKPILWLWKVCIAEGRKRREEPQWGLYSRLATKFGLAADAQLSEKVYETTKKRVLTPAWQPSIAERTEERPLVDEWLNFERFRRSEQCKRNEEIFGFAIKNPFNHCLRLFLNQDTTQRDLFMQSYPEYWNDLQKEELSCQKSTLSLDLPCHSNELDSEKHASIQLKKIFEHLGR